MLRPLVAALLTGAFVLGLTSPGWGMAAQPPDPLNCPRGAIVWLAGSGRPSEAVLVLVEGRVVGGGSADGAGRWQIPLSMNEPDGSYLVRVVSRDTREAQATYTCLVGPQGEASAPPTPAAAGDASPRASATPRAVAPTPTRALPSPTATASATALAPTATALAPTATATASLPGATRTPSATPTTRPSATGTARPTVDPRELITPSPTAVAGVADRLAFAEVMGGDPSSLEDGFPIYGYVAIRSRGGDPIDLTGWQLASLTHPERPVFTFPAFLLPTRGSVTVMPDVGESSAELIYWGIEQIVWVSGDRLALRTPQGLSALTVTVP